MNRTHASKRAYGKGGTVRLSAFAPNVERFGFALFLTCNATSVWGGIFPFLPDVTRTSGATVAFYALQLAAYSLAFLAFLIVSYRSPDKVRSISVVPGSGALAASGIMLVGAMYLEAASMALIIASAICLGVGAACFMIGWQRVFASQDADAGGLSIIVGVGYSAALYFLICLIPVALTAYLIPLVFVPLAGLCLWIAAQRVDFEQAMFEDRPADHPAIYLNVMKESLAAAISIGAMGFCAGAVRFILITHQSISSVVNLASMGVLLAAVLIYLVLWSGRTLRFNVMSFYRVIFPVMGVGLMLLPFMGESVSTLGAAISYACFSLATIVMMMHCCQISRDSGINPVFIYAMFGTVVYAIQIAGYFVGYASEGNGALGVGQLSAVAVVSLFVLLVASLAAGHSRPLHTTRLEFLAPSPKRLRPAPEPRIVATNVVQVIDVEPQASTPDESRAHDEDGQPGARRPLDMREPSGERDPFDTNAPSGEHDPLTAFGSAHEKGDAHAERWHSSGPVIDRLSKQCRHVADEYGLSARETEVMELLGRGRTGPAIANELFISENTVRTHIKRIYAKVGVSKKQELLAVLEHTSPA